MRRPVMKNGETVWTNYERFLSTCVNAFDQAGRATCR